MKYLATLCIIVSLAICSCKKSQEASAPPDPKDEFFAIIQAKQDAFAAGDAQKLADLSLEKSARKMKEHYIQSGKGWPPPPEEIKKGWEVMKNFMGELFPDKQKTVLQIEGDWARLKYLGEKKETIALFKKENGVWKYLSASACDGEEPYSDDGMLKGRKSSFNPRFVWPIREELLELPPIELTMRLSDKRDEKGYPQFNFYVKNVSDRPIEQLQLESNFNSVSYRVNDYAICSSSLIKFPAVLKPGEEIMVDDNNGIYLGNPPGPGTYILQWKIDDYSAPKITLNLEE